MKKRLIFLVVGVILLLPNIISAAVIDALSCELVDVQTAIDTATYGDTVIVPAGNCVWTSGVEITKNIRIVGAGVDETILTLGFTDDNTQEAFFKFVPDATSRDNLNELVDSYTFEVTGITFAGEGRMRYKYGVWIRNKYLPVIKRVSIHHNKFIDLSQAAKPYGYVHGVCHSNVVINSCITYTGGLGWRSFDNDRMTLGSGDGWYIEDNTIFSPSSTMFGAVNDGYGIIFRYNTEIGDFAGGGTTYMETHGNQPKYIYGPQITVVYGNSINGTASRITNCRGGKNIYFNNVFQGASIISIWEEFSDLATSDTSPIGKCSENQGVERQTCIDDCICQKVHDSYFWNNRASVDGALRTATILADNSCGIGVMDCECRWVDTSTPPSSTGYCTEIISNDPPELVENIEFFNFVASGFDGTSGVGCGTLANRPATCTIGVGYWATDQSCSDLTGMVGANPTTPILGTLYKCENLGDTIGWTAYYTPYTYPHPLTQLSSSNCSSADTNTDGVVSITELMNYIGDWKLGSVAIEQLMTAIGEWKNGC